MNRDSIFVEDDKCSRFTRTWIVAVCSLRTISAVGLQGHG